MPKTRSRKIADLLSPASVAGTLSVDGGGGVATYTAIGDLPSSGLTAGDMAFVDSSDRLYIWAGSGWYNIALINRAPTIQSVLDGDGGSSPFALSLEGVATTITMLAQDSDGTPITYSAVADYDFNTMATVSQLSNVFTITPTAIEGNTTGTITFKASDGINLASEISTFTLSFITVIENSKYTSLLVQSTGANNGTNSTFTDASANNLTLTAAGNTVATTFSPYRAGGYSTYFNGTNDYMTFPGQTTSQGKFTIEAWVNLSVLRNYQLIYDNRTSGATTSGYAFGVNVAGQPYLYTSGGFQLISSISIGINTWNHIALVRGGTFANALQLYVNGVLAGTQTLSNVFDDFTQNGIGVALTSIAGSQFFGYMSDLRIVNGVDVYTSNFTPPTEPLTAIAGTTLLTCQNNRFVDNSLNATTLTVVGAPTIAPYRPYDYKPYDPVVNGGSVYFNGTGYITSTVSGGLGTGNFTLEWWDYLESVGSGMLFNSRTGGTGGDGMDVSADLNITKASEVLFGPVTTATNIWRHVALVRSGSTLTRYINGVVQGSVASTSDFNGSTFYIGGNPAGNSGYMLGHISNFRAVNGTAVYTSAFTPPTEPLTAISGTSLLINGDGGSIIDASQTSALTLFDTAKSSTTQIKYGNSSIKTSSPGNYVLTSNDAISFGADEDFTIEGWVNWLSLTGDQGIFQVIPNDQTFELGSQGSYPLMMMVWGGIGVGLNGGYTQSIWNSGNNPNINQWYHLAVSRSSGITKVFVDGVPVHTYGPASWATSGRLALGGYATTNHISDAYFQDWRYTKGLARYTTTFTPPAALLEG
jgi:hypothetical protein